jgi:hypothetical protein
LSTYRSASAAVHPFFLRQMLEHNRERLLERGEKLLGGLGVVTIHAESHDPLSLLSDTLFAFAHVAAHLVKCCFDRVHELYRSDATKKVRP